GEYADGGARVEVIDLKTGRRRVVSDSHGEGRAHRDEGAGGGDVGTQSFTPADRCSDANAAEFTYVSGGGVDRYWHAVEAWTYNPTNADSSAPNWRSEIVAASNAWQNSTNPCGISDTIGWITPTTWTDDTTATVPKNTCVGHPQDGKNTFGWRQFDNDSFVAWACVFRSGTWVIEGDVGFNTLTDLCHNPCSGYDMRATALHEWGHILGLGHPCSFGGSDDCDTAAEEAAAMFPSLVGHTTLSRGDIEGAKTLYPNETGYTVQGTTLENPAGSTQKLTPGHEYTLHVDLKNTGMRAWKIDANDPFVLSTRTQSPSDFAGSDWVTTSRPSRVDDDRTENSTNPTDTVVRDEVGRFTFKVKIPLTSEGNPAAALDALGLLNGSSFVTGPDVNRSFDVGTFDTTLLTNAGQPVLTQGSTTAVESWIDVKNDGTAPWWIGETLMVQPAGGTCSAFAASNWRDCQTASFIDENLTKLQAPTSPVLPGEMGRFRFHWAAPVNPALTGLHTVTLETRRDGGTVEGTSAAFQLVVL
ncbi:MAG: hypothetical protein HYU28_00665, partial [Actinobacteria bacterium]|nr:hypothetical protein [Actinomycetota bacterium]